MATTKKKSPSEILAHKRALKAAQMKRYRERIATNSRAVTLTRDEILIVNGLLQREMQRTKKAIHDPRFVALEAKFRLLRAEVGS